MGGDKGEKFFTKGDNGSPYPVARALMQSSVIEAIESYEPRARVESVTFDETLADAMDGILCPRVIISIGEEEEE